MKTKAINSLARERTNMTRSNDTNFRSPSEKSSLDRFKGREPKTREREHDQPAGIYEDKKT